MTRASELEAEQYVQELRHLRDELDHAMVVRNGYARERAVQPGASPVKIKAPKVKRGLMDDLLTRRARVKV